MREGVVTGPAWTPLIPARSFDGRPLRAPWRAVVFVGEVCESGPCRLDGTKPGGHVEGRHPS